MVTPFLLREFEGEIDYNAKQLASYIAVRREISR
jgi:hypothetical protein